METDKGERAGGFSSLIFEGISEIPLLPLRGLSMSSMYV
jgi:hypothetical protein